MKRSLMPLARLYSAGVKLRQRAFQQGWLKSQRLSRPVISVGNLTVGGSGKTPLVAMTAGVLLRCGYKPGILTRGYRRERGADLIALEPHSQRAPDSRKVGDEAALLAHQLPQVPIVICANRYLAGRLAEEQFGVNVHILDDGFQHFALERDVDLVAVDLTQDLFHDALLPAGRLREPLSALVRADMMVLTRTEIEDAAPMEKQLSLINSEASIFRSAMKLRGLIGLGSRRSIGPEDYRGKQTCAFCGLGNPPAFFSDLRRWGFNPVAEVAFRDHHVYSTEDLKRLNKIAKGTGAEAFLTTEKDLMNIPLQPVSKLPILACAIQAEITDAVRFEQALVARLASKQLPSKVVS